VRLLWGQGVPHIIIMTTLLLNSPPWQSVRQCPQSNRPCTNSRRMHAACAQPPASHGECVDASHVRRSGGAGGASRARAGSSLLPALATTHGAAPALTARSVRLLSASSPGVCHRFARRSPPPHSSPTQPRTATSDMPRPIRFHHQAVPVHQSIVCPISGPKLTRRRGDERGQLQSHGPGAVAVPGECAC
jgi:hypothetical protein